jgi:hypothetical protein
MNNEHHQAFCHPELDVFTHVISKDYKNSLLREEN